MERKPKLSRFKLHDLVLWGNSFMGEKKKRIKITDKDNSILPIFLQVYVCMPYAVGSCFNDGKFSADLVICGKQEIQDYSLVKVTRATVFSLDDNEDYYDEKLKIGITCEVVIEGQYIWEFTTIDTPINIDVNDLTSNLKSIKEETDASYRLRSDLWIQAKNQEHTDVQFLLPGGECLHAHKAILCSSTEVFQRHFAKDSPYNDKNIVEITDSTVETFHDFLHYIYKGYTYLYNLKHHFDLLYLAKKYLVTKFEERIKDYLSKRFFKAYYDSNGESGYDLPPMKFLSIHMLNRIVKDKQMEKSTILMGQNALSIIHNPDFLDLPYEDINEFMSIDQPIEATPIQLFEAVLSWAHKQEQKMKNENVDTFTERLQDNVEILLSKIKNEETNVDSTIDLGLDNFSMLEIINSLAFNVKIKQKVREKLKDCYTPFLKEAQISGSSIRDPFYDQFMRGHGARSITCHSVNMSKFMHEEDDQTVFSKKMKLATVSAHVQILFQRDAGYDATGNVTLILTKLPEEAQEEKYISARIEFLLYDEFSKPLVFKERYYAFSCHDRYVMTDYDRFNVQTKSRNMQSGKVYNWVKMTEPNMPGAMVHFKIYVEEKPAEHCTE